MNCILVCIDFSPLTDRILDTAKEIALGMSRRLHLVHVQPEKRPVPTAVVSNPDNTTARTESLARRKEIARLERMCQKLNDENIQTTWSGPSGRIPETIMKEAKDHGAQLVVMGSHGNGAMYHLVVGSVAEGVLKGLGVPVVLVPANVSN
jgi:nucleotide-binding universal stress UspA family protein